MNINEIEKYSKLKSERNRKLEFATKLVSNDIIVGQPDYYSPSYELQIHQAQQIINDLKNINHNTQFDYYDSIKNSLADSLSSNSPINVNNETISVLALLI